MNKTITFIGAGNMSRSLIAGLIQDNTPHQIRVSDPDQTQLQAIKQSYPDVEIFNDNIKAIEASDIIVLAVKPQIMQTVCEALQSQLQNNPVMISIAAGVSIENIDQWLGANSRPIVRCMPNTPALVQSGMTGLYANAQVSEQQHDLAESILRAVGCTLWLENEELLDAVTAVSGSGPAYFFLVMESMQDAAKKLGLNAADARLLVLQTALGAAKLAMESSDDTATLRQRVTSKGGTTEAALNQLIEGGLPALFEDALNAAATRSIELRKI